MTGLEGRLATVLIYVPAAEAPITRSHDAGGDLESGIYARRTLDVAFARRRQRGQGGTRGGGRAMSPNDPPGLTPAAPPQGMSAEEQLERWMGDFDIFAMPEGDRDKARKLLAAARADERVKVCEHLCRRCAEKNPLEYNYICKQWMHAEGGQLWGCHADHMHRFFGKAKPPEAQPVEPSKGRVISTEQFKEEYEGKFLPKPPEPSEGEGI